MMMNDEEGRNDTNTGSGRRGRVNKTEEKNIVPA